MSIALLLALGAITWLSRAAPMVLLPHPPPRLRRLLERIPAPLFAALAAVTLIDADGGLVDLPILTASIAAVSVAWRGSMPLTLVGGIAGYAIGRLALGTL